jgi:queuine tRNA-ribosyltransferase
MAMKFAFDLLAQDGAARRGVIHTAHGDIETPAFMPVGTAATVKGLLPDAVSSCGADVVLGNTYHLMLRPGAERIERLGGLHKFMNWPGPILTDSGGFQVMSLAELRKMSEEGVAFRSHIDGARVMLTPESSIDIQRRLDADITMVLDECTSWPASHDTAASSMELSMRWAARCRDAFTERAGYGLFGIVQGSIYQDLRARSAEALTGLGFDGYAVGGLAIGEGQDVTFQVLDWTVPLLPAARPRYLMGVGRPEDIVGAVLRGVDMFDCVLPTRSGRTGQLFTPRGPINIRNARHRDDPRPVDEGCVCPCCRDYTRAYLHHLFRSREMLGPILATWHNIRHYQDLMAGLRSAIEVGNLQEHAAQLARNRDLGDIDPN